MNQSAIEHYYAKVASQYPGGIANLNISEEAIVFPLQPGEEVLVEDSRPEDEEYFIKWLNGRKIRQYTWGLHHLDNWSMAKVGIIK